MEFIYNICSCFCIPKNKIEPTNSDTISDINYKISKYFIEKNHIELLNISIIHIYNFICNITPTDFIQLNLNDSFIINFYKESSKNIDTDSKRFLTGIITKIITLYVFFYDCIDVVTFLIDKKYLFDYNLWIHLLLNPDYDDDINKINRSLLLARYRILPVYKTITFYNVQLNIFELIIIGKMKFDVSSNKLIWIRFFDTNVIHKFIIQLKTNITIQNTTPIIKSLETINTTDIKNIEYINMIKNIL